MNAHNQTFSTLRTQMKNVQILEYLTSLIGSNMDKESVLHLKARAGNQICFQLQLC